MPERQPFLASPMVVQQGGRHGPELVARSYSVLALAQDIKRPDTSPSYAYLADPICRPLQVNLDIVAPPATLLEHAVGGRFDEHFAAPSGRNRERFSVSDLGGLLYLGQHYQGCAGQIGGELWTRIEC